MFIEWLVVHRVHMAAAKQDCSGSDRRILRRGRNKARSGFGAPAPIGIHFLNSCNVESVILG